MDLVDLSTEVLLDPRLKKKWLDKKKIICYMICPSSLGVIWGNDEDYWTWEYFQEPSGDHFEVAKLIEVCWFEIRGKINMSELSCKVDYEAVYVVKLSEWACGWDSPLMLRLKFPDTQYKNAGYDSWRSLVSSGLSFVLVASIFRMKLELETLLSARFRAPHQTIGNMD